MVFFFVDIVVFCLLVGFCLFVLSTLCVLFLCSLQARIQAMHIAKKFYSKPDLVMRIEVSSTYDLILKTFNF